MICAEEPPREYLFDKASLQTVLAAVPFHPLISVSNPVPNPHRSPSPAVTGRARGRSGTAAGSPGARAHAQCGGVLCGYKSARRRARPLSVQRRAAGPGECVSAMAPGPAGRDPPGARAIAAGAGRAGAPGRPAPLTGAACVCICSRNPGGDRTHRERHGRGRVSRAGAVGGGGRRGRAAACASGSGAPAVPAVPGLLPASRGPGDRRWARGSPGRAAVHMAGRQHGPAARQEDLMPWLLSSSSFASYSFGLILHLAFFLYFFNGRMLADEREAFAFS